MTLSAQCHHCSRPFDLTHARGTDPGDADRCPRCRAHLGTIGLGHLTFRIDRHLAGLERAVRDLADRPGDFSVDTAALRARAIEAIDALDRPPALDTSTRVVSAARS